MMKRTTLEGGMLAATAAFLLAVPWLIPAIADRF